MNQILFVNQKFDYAASPIKSRAPEGSSKKISDPKFDTKGKRGFIQK
jgi:hypothetical protein